jgi:hypothetical protein
LAYFSCGVPSSTSAIDAQREVVGASNDCGPYNISQDDCRLIKSMTQDELRQAVEQDDEEKRRDYYRGR